MRKEFENKWLKSWQRTRWQQLMPLFSTLRLWFKSRVIIAVLRVLLFCAKIATSRNSSQYSPFHNDHSQITTDRSRTPEQFIRTGFPTEILPTRFFSPSQLFFPFLQYSWRKNHHYYNERLVFPAVKVPLPNNWPWIGDTCQHIIGGAMYRAITYIFCVII